jgi:hypothetical protein
MAIAADYRPSGNCMRPEYREWKAAQAGGQVGAARPIIATASTCAAG